MTRITRVTSNLGKRRYKKIIHLFTEGAVTEPQYFGIFNDINNDTFYIKHIPGKHKSAVKQVLKRIKTFLANAKIYPSDEIWAVIDIDNWKREDIDEMLAWAKTNENFGVALSNPSFEYWILLHFEDGNNVTGKNDCLTRLKAHMSDYEKRLNLRLLTKDRIISAVIKARDRHRIHAHEHPMNIEVTTVYQLVEKLL